jgi:hypothetical protein
MGIGADRLIRLEIMESCNEAVNYYAAGLDKRNCHGKEP